VLERNVDPLDEVLIGIEPVPDDRASLYFELPSLEQRRDACRPLGSRLAEYELCSIIRMVKRLGEGQINETKRTKSLQQSADVGSW
jgi:hypothetical protein